MSEVEAYPALLPRYSLKKALVLDSKLRLVIRYRVDNIDQSIGEGEKNAIKRTGNEP